jgi:hypothetical protein
MDPKQRAQLQAYADAWDRYSVVAEEMRRKELRELDAKGGPDLMRFGEMLDFGRLHARIKTASGLVEQQRLFGLLRVKEESGSEQ